MRKKIVAGNWKMNKTLAEGVQLINEVKELLAKQTPKQSPAELGVVFGTPFITLATAAELVKDNAYLSVAAQNCYTKESGAYTGETAVGMIKAVGVSNVIIGHSERREYFNESNQMLAEKVDIILKNGLTPIFCCGERLETRNEGKHFDWIKQQIEESLFHLSAEEFGKVVIAYEPIWAIGTGVTASTEQAQEVHAFIRSILVAKYGAKVADDTTILYGGSCNAANAKELFACADVDGGLIGGASLKAQDFVTIITSF